MGGEVPKNSDWGGLKGPGIHNDLGPLEDLHLLALLSQLSSRTVITST